jgi:16S rRNA processing protein RimM
MPAFGELVLIGRCVKPQGRHGELLIESFSDRPDRFPGLRRAFVADGSGGAREVRVAGCRPHKGRFALKLEGVDSIEEAERLRGAELRIPERDLLPLSPGAFYHHQLQGLRAVDGAGAELGHVLGVLDTGAGASVLLIRGEAGETLLPFAQGFVEGVDLDAGRIVVRRPEYVVAD